MFRLLRGVAIHGYESPYWEKSSQSAIFTVSINSNWCPTRYTNIESSFPLVFFCLPNYFEGITNSVSYLQYENIGEEGSHFSVDLLKQIYDFSCIISASRS